MNERPKDLTKNEDEQIEKKRTKTEWKMIDTSSYPIPLAAAIGAQQNGWTEKKTSTKYYIDEISFSATHFVICDVHD